MGAEKQEQARARSEVLGRQKRAGEERLQDEKRSETKLLEFGYERADKGSKTFKLRL